MPPKDTFAKNIPAPKRSIDFQNDTLDIKRNDDGFAVAYMSSEKNTITVNIREGLDNSFNQAKSTLVHEQKHRDNNNAGIYSLNMSLEQHYKTRCLDEISANICELLELREEYLSAKTDAERQAIMDSSNASQFSYYFDAVKSGQINPQSQDPAALENELRFIGQKTQKMWMNDFAPAYDGNTHTPSASFFLSTHDYQELAPNEENYQKARQIALGNIGGIDFTQYLDDIDCYNPNIKEADKLIAQGSPRAQVKTALKGHKVCLSLAGHTKLEILNASKKFISELEEVRNAYLNAKTPAEREAIKASDYSIAAQWLTTVKAGGFPLETPMSDKEKEYIGTLLAQNSPDMGYGDMDNLKSYYNDFGAQNIAAAIKSGEAEKNYQQQKQQLYTIGGVDFSNYISDPVIFDPHIAALDKKIISNTPLNDKDFTPFDQEKEIFKPELKLNKNLSPEQQFRIAQHQMFIENALMQAPFLKTLRPEDLKRVTNIDEAVQYTIDDFRKKLKENPALAAEWAKKEQELANEIALANQSRLFIPKGDDKAYAKELKNTYTVNGINLLDLYGKEFNPETTIEKKTPAVITDVKNSSFFTRLKNKTAKTISNAATNLKQAFNKLKNKFKSKNQTNNKPDERSGRKAQNNDYKKKYTYTPYTGEPQYDTNWSPVHRVSDILHKNITDFTQPFLQKRLENLQKRASADRAKSAAATAYNLTASRKFDRRVNQSAQTSNHSAQPNQNNNNNIPITPLPQNTSNSR